MPFGTGDPFRPRMYTWHGGKYLARSLQGGGLIWIFVAGIDAIRLFIRLPPSPLLMAIPVCRSYQFFGPILATSKVDILTS